MFTKIASRIGELNKNFESEKQKDENSSERSESVEDDGNSDFPGSPGIGEDDFASNCFIERKY
jgi:hypothetical protein